MITVTLPWPSPKLSPNARVHWAQRATLVATARAEASEALGRFALDHFKECAALDLAKPIPMLWIFHPPTLRRPDRDNLVGQCKSYQDGLADAMGVNDRNFVPTYNYGPLVEGGAVVVVIGPLVNWGKEFDDKDIDNGEG